MCLFYTFFFFFQAEDGIRDPLVTGVQTCALPIFSANTWWQRPSLPRKSSVFTTSAAAASASRCWRRTDMSGPAWSWWGPKIGRASCREREENMGGAVAIEKKSKRLRYEQTCKLDR